MKTQTRGARRRVLFVLSLLLIIPILGLGWWSTLARRANHSAPFDQLVLEIVAPSMRLAAGVRARVVRAPHYAVAPMTAVGLERLRQLEEENQQLRATLRLCDHLPTQGIVAEVIGRNNIPWEGNLIIGKGSADGILPHMVAIVPDGVLGQVAEVSAHMAKILPLTDTASGIPAMTTRSKSPGVLKGDGTGKCRLLYLSGDADIVPGDQLITSGLGLVFPRGLPLGQVAAVNSDTTLSSRTANIMPAVDPTTVDFVVLVK